MVAANLTQMGDPPLASQVRRELGGIQLGANGESDAAMLYPEVCARHPGNASGGIQFRRD